MPAVKICGICQLEDAVSSVEFGADFIGFVFADSPRKIEAAESRAIIRKLRGKTRFVGVFKNADQALVNDTADALGLDFVQLHGEESPEYCSGIKAPVIKAVNLDPSTLKLAYLGNYRVHALLFDRAKDKSADKEWLLNLSRSALFEELQSWQPFFLAGGLEEQNLDLALKFNPYGLDTASGVEAKPGIKDRQKLEAFIKGAKRIGQ